MQVTLTHDFEIQQTEMTQAEWTSLGNPNPSTQHLDAGDGGSVYGDCLGPQCPVGNVTLEDVMAAANQLSTEHQPPLPPCYTLSGCTGSPGQGMKCSARSITTATTYECTGYRLPTEAEWEYAARAGTTTPLYNGDVVHSLACVDDVDMDEIGWYCFNSNGFTHPVEQKLANGWGLYDTSGNALEWTSTQYSGSGYGPGPLIDPMGSLGSYGLVVRGGVANFRTNTCRSAARSAYFNFGYRAPLMGFRLVRTLPALDAGAGDASGD